MANDPERLNLSPSPGDEPEPTEVTEPEEPVAGEDTPGETPQPERTEVNPWDSFKEQFPGIHKELIGERRRNDLLRDRMEERGFVFDESGNIVTEPAERALEQRGKVATDAEVDKIIAQYGEELDAAEVSGTPGPDRARIIRRMAREIADAARDEAVGVVSAPVNEIVVDTFKDGLKRNPVFKGIIGHAEPILDALVKQVESEARKAGRGIVLNRQVLGSLWEMAVGKAYGRSVSTPPLGQRPGARVAGAVNLAPGNTAAEREVPVTLDENEAAILGSLARGGGVEEKDLRKAYAQAKRGGR